MRFERVLYSRESQVQYVTDREPTFLFIGGLHRSGTSLLYRCITEHPEISGFSGTGSPKDEGQHLQDVYPPTPKFGGPGFFGFNSGSYLDESSRLVNRESREQIFDEWAEHWDLSKPILAEKSPPNLIRMRFLQALFPKTRFVMIVRHPIAVSYATQKWTNLLTYLTRKTLNRGIPPWLRSKLPTLKSPIWLLIKHWIVCHEKLSKDIDKVKDVLVLKYESLTDKPKKTLEKVWDFLNLETVEPKREIRRGVNQKYFKRWRHQTEGVSVIGQFYSKYVFPEYEDRINEFGYTLNV